MKYLTRALAAEYIKIRKTLGMWSAVIAPIFIVAINFLIFYNRPQLFEEPETNPWIVFTTFSMNSWSILLLPLFITLLTFYVNYTEHKASGWKYIYSLPLPKLSVYSAKFIISLIILFSAMTLYYVLNLAAIETLSEIYPNVPFNAFDESVILMKIFGGVFIGALAILAIQFFVSLLVHNFVFPLGFGVFATIAHAMLLQWEHANFLPYAYPFMAKQQITFTEMNISPDPMLLSVLVASLFFIMGYIIHWRVNIN